MARRGENIYKRKDGRYEGRYVVGRTEKGRTKFGYVYSRQYNTVKEELVRRKSENQVRARAAGRDSLTLSACMTSWLSELRGSVKQSSYQTYRSLAEKHVLPAIGSMPLPQVTAEAIFNFAENLIVSGLACSTVKGICRLVSACLRYALEEGHIAKNPCRKLRIPMEQMEKQRILTNPEQERVSRAAQESSELSVLLAAYTGMRLGEICALKWTDIDWEKGTICVCRTVQRIRRAGGGTILIVDTPKSLRSRRTLPVPAFIIDLLKKQSRSTLSEYIFGEELRPAEPRTVQRRFQKFMKRIGIAGAHFHTLRHSFATRLIELGVDIKTVSTLLGHSSAKTTLDFYAHSRLDMQRSAVEKLAAV